MPTKMQVMLTVKSLDRSKITRMETMKRLHKDNKALFGGLLEKSKEKIAREKREREGRASEQTGVELPQSRTAKETDTEAYYVLRARDRQYYRFKVPRLTLPYSTKKILFVDDRQKKTETKEAVKESLAVESEEIAESGVPKAEVQPVPKFKPVLSPVLINQMVNFHYLDMTKDEVEPPEASRILSISPNEDKSKLYIPSVTKILNKTMSEQSRLNLELWKQKMIGELGVEGFENYRQELLINGKQFHSSIQNYLTQSPFEVPSAVKNSWQSVQHVLKEIDEVKAIETHVVHLNLRYRGIVDCVAKYRGDLCVIDWKKSDKPKPSIDMTFDAPIQVASYIGAVNADPNYKFQVRKGVVVVGYTNGDPASVYEMNPKDMNKYWKFWVRRLQQYYWELTDPKQHPIDENKI